MIAIDTSALLAIFRQEPEAEYFLKIIVKAEERWFSVLSLLEASMVISGRSSDAAIYEPLDAFLTEGGIRLTPFDAEQARLAREAYLHYGKGRHKAGLNLGDCVSYALAKSRNAPLLFKGKNFSFTDIMTAAVPPVAPA